MISDMFKTDMCNIKNYINNAYNNVPFYQKFYSDIDIDKIVDYDSFRQLPILNKSQLQDSNSSYISKLYNINDLRIGRTSGSTGRILSIYWDKFEFFKSNKELWRYRNQFYGITAADKLLTFHPYLNRDKDIFNPKISLQNNSILSMSLVDLNSINFEFYYEKMLEFEPVWILGTASALFLFSKYIKDNNLKTPRSIKYIELMGEYLSESYRKFIRETFNVPIANQYGSRETNAIGIECQYGNMHHMNKNILVEILNDNDNPVCDGEEGNIIITNMMNNAMPLIRYRLGDRGKYIENNDCKCCSNRPILQITAGRVTDRVILENRDPINAVVFWYVIEKINLKYNLTILQFQVIQESLHLFSLKLSIKDETLENIIVKDFYKEIGVYNLNDKIDWEISFVNEIPFDTKTSKLKYFICKI